MSKRDLNLTWGENSRRTEGVTHLEWHAPCGCAFHPEPVPHVHQCLVHAENADLVQRLRTEADLCSNERAYDIADLLNEAANVLEGARK